MDTATLCAYLENYLQVSSISDFCPNGLQVEGKGRINQLATAVSASLATIEMAVERGAQALLVHHGIFWNRDPYPIIGIKKKKIELLIQHGIALLAYHLPLDAHQELGNNWKAAKDLGWVDLEPFGMYNKMPLGVKGKFPEKTREHFSGEVEAYYQHPVSLAPGGKKLVSSAALISGGAHKEITQAIDAGVDCYVTGSFDEPIWNIALEEQINFLAVGHSASEKIGVKALGDHLAIQFGLQHTFLDVFNPF